MPQTTIPYLTVKGAGKAIEFYRKAFGATENGRVAAQDGRRLMHADLTINGGSVMLSDEFSEHGGPPAPTLERPTSVSIMIAFTSPRDVDATFDRAVAAGARGSMQPEDAFWGSRFAMLDDPFGHRWMLTAPLKAGV